jgi:hypothetical protein
MDKIQIRGSQFITNYGVGSLIEGPDGPGIVLNYDISGCPAFKSGTEIDTRFIISFPGCSRVGRRILDTGFITKKKIGIFEFPTNAKLEEKDSKNIYQLKKFPTWSICNRHGKKQILYWRSKKCPICSEESTTGESASLGDTEVIRFVRICAKGHLTEVNWVKEAHPNKPMCKTAYIEWIDEGNSLDKIKIKCPNCGDFNTFNNIIRNPTTSCDGYYPEKFKESKFLGHTEKCDKKTQIVPRNASNVFIPEIITTIALPFEANGLFNIINSKHVYNHILRKITAITRKFGSKIKEVLKIQPDALDDIFDSIKSELDFDVSSGIEDARPYLHFFEMIEKDPEITEEKRKANEIITEFIKNLESNHEPLGDLEIKRQEFDIFKNSTGSLKIDPTLVIDRKKREDFSLNGFEFSAIPISRLEVLMVQSGYRRLANPPKVKTDISIKNPKLVHRYFHDNNENDWFAGVKLNGEGIFIFLKNPDELREKLTQIKEGIIEQWRKCYAANTRFNEIYAQQIREKNDEELLDDPDNIVIAALEYAGLLDDAVKKDEKKLKSEINRYYSWFMQYQFKRASNFTDPISIWWHTLSHRLIKAISIDCGYSLASIRERIYYNPDTNEGGILIYSCRPGEDGTMGGLVSQIKRIKSIFEIALKDLEYCSNDPECRRHSFHPVSLNGSACYACQFLPETSCEFANVGLDRGILIELMRGYHP